MTYFLTLFLTLFFNDFIFKIELKYKNNFIFPPIAIFHISNI